MENIGNLPNTGILVLLGSPMVTSTPSGIASYPMAGCTLPWAEARDLPDPPDAADLRGDRYCTSLKGLPPIEFCVVGRSTLLCGSNWREALEEALDVPRTSKFSGRPRRERGCCISGKRSVRLCPVAGRNIPTCDIFTVAVTPLFKLVKN